MALSYTISFFKSYQFNSHSEFHQIQTIELPLSTTNFIQIHGFQTQAETKIHKVREQEHEQKTVTVEE